jgi:hypothetical protein
MALLPLALLALPPPIAAAAAAAAAPSFSCSRGLTIANSNRTAADACAAGVAGDECGFACDPGYLAIGRHVCQNYSTMGVAVINQAFFGGRCEKLCGRSAAEWSCAAGLVPVRLNTTSSSSSSSSSGDGAACLSTTCLSPAEALRRLARGNWEVWRLGRHNRTGMYIDHVNPLLPYEQQQWTMASADSAGPGLAMECVAAALGYISPAEAASRVLLTLHSFAGLTPGFHDTRNQGGWLPTFMDPGTGECLIGDPKVGCLFSTDSTAFNTVGILFAKTFFERTAPHASSTAEISRLASQLFRRVNWSELFCSRLVGMGQEEGGTVTRQGPFIPWLYNATSGCSDSFGPAPDGFYYFSEMHWLVWLAHASVCNGGNGGTKNPPACNNASVADAPVEQLWRAWEGESETFRVFFAIFLIKHERLPSQTRGTHDENWQTKARFAQAERTTRKVAPKFPGVVATFLLPAL